MRFFTTISVRRVRVAMAVGVISSLGLLPASPVGATPTDCPAAWQEMEVLVAQESESGLTNEWLQRVNELAPAIESCSEEDEIERWRPLVSVFFEPTEVERVMCLMNLESRGDENAQNRSSDAAGLMQVMPFWASHFGYTYADLFDPVINLKVASNILDIQGWTAWSPYKRGSCR